MDVPTPSAIGGLLSPAERKTGWRNLVDPYAYLRNTLEAIAAGHPQSRLDELLP